MKSRPTPTMQKLLGPFLVLLFTISIVGLRCSDSNFAGGPSKANPTKEGGNSNPSDTDYDDLDPGRFSGNYDDEAPIRVFDVDGAPGTHSFLRTIEENLSNHFWMVTRQGAAYYFELEDDEVTVRKRWGRIVAPGGGSRTYVTEGGIVITRTGGHYYWIDPKATPEGPIPKNPPHFFRLKGVTNNDRSCVVSYRREGKRYLGIGYGKKFVEFAMKNEPPYPPIWSEITAQIDMDRVWGYSCFIDQRRLIYYGASHNNVQAIDLKKLEKVPAPDVAPNGKFSSDNLKAETVGPKVVNGKQHSYAISGDRDGNVLNGQNFYTFAHEPRSDTIWASGRSGAHVVVYPAECFSTKKVCQGHRKFDQAKVSANIRPMSAFGDGRVIGILRANNKGHAYLMRLKNPKKIDAGLDVTRVVEIPGDPYMYTDFTGATLYLTKTQYKLDLNEDDSFEAKAPIRGLGFSWLSHDRFKQEWRDIELNIRCYQDGSTPPEYDQVTKIKNAPEQTFITTKSCAADAKYDHVGILMRQLNNGETLMNVRKIQITVYQ